MMLHLSGLTIAWLIIQLLLIIMMNFVVPIFTTSWYLTSILFLGCFYKIGGIGTVPRTSLPQESRTSPLRSLSWTTLDRGPTDTLQSWIATPLTLLVRLVLTCVFHSNTVFVLLSNVFSSSAPEDYRTVKYGLMYHAQLMGQVLNKMIGEVCIC